MVWFLALLRAIPGLAKLLGLFRADSKQAHAEVRRKEKYARIDARIAAAKRGVRDGEEEQH